ncbi:Uu.00g028950.m01.CDS01 [Anthostomella pinea]|uniref:Uu.00g028950.m01.CDS01 n=1 Tax=Anthostomella pinea TaxID=933095 RepID=A0AAI8YCV0_9PEZI|nr:Uu.00g028950.m01.CDS01 [Anthostomella pinea]
MRDVYVLLAAASILSAANGTPINDPVPHSASLPTTTSLAVRHDDLEAWKTVLPAPTSTALAVRHNSLSPRLGTGIDIVPAGAWKVFGQIVEEPRLIAAAVFSVGTGIAAYEVCRLWLGDRDNGKCLGIGRLIVSIIVSILSGVWLSESFGVTKLLPNALSRRSVTLAGRLESDLRSRGLVFDSIDVMSLAKRGEADDGANVFNIRGMTAGDLALDTSFTVREDGSGHATVAPPAPEGSLAAREVTTRSGGFKIDYKFAKGKGKIEKVDFDFEKIAGAIGDDWESRAEQIKGRNYLATIHAGNDNIFNFLIQPKDKAFEVKYEEVKDEWFPKFDVDDIDWKEGDLLDNKERSFHLGSLV